MDAVHLPVALTIVPAWLKVPVALGALVSFMASLLAAVCALQLYQLLRTGAIGQSWKVFIGAALVLLVHEVAHIVRIFDFFDDFGMYEATKFLFVTMLAYGFYLQRRVFFSPHVFRSALNHRRPQSTALEPEPLSSEMSDDDRPTISAPVPGRSAD